MIRRLMVAVAVAVLGLLVAAPAQAAEWCLHDPALVFSAPHAKHTRLTVYATEGVQGADHAGALERAHLDFKTKPGHTPGTVQVDVHANIPGNDHERFSTVLVVSSEPFGAGEVYGVTMGTSGHDMHVSFSLVYQDGG
jgi:hypothetical protein